MARYIKGEAVGRPKGINNKVTTIQREYIQGLLDGEKERIKADLELLEAKDYYSVILGLMEFIIPKLQRTEITGNIEVKQIVGMIIK